MWGKGGEAREGGRKEGKLQGRYREEDSGEYTAYGAQNNLERGTCL